MGVVTSTRIWPKPFVKRDVTEKQATNQLWFIGLDIAPNILNQGYPYHVPLFMKSSIDVNSSLANFNSALTSHSERFYTNDMVITAYYAHKTDLTSKEESHSPLHLYTLPPIESQDDPNLTFCVAHLSEKDIATIVESQSQTRVHSPSSSPSPPAAGSGTGSGKFYQYYC